MDKTKVVKKIGGVIIGAGVTTIVANIVKNNTPGTCGLIGKGCIVVGSVVLGKMLADKAVEFAEQEFDDFVNEMKDVVK